MDDCSQPPPAEHQLPRQLPRHHQDQLRILAFGDSLTAGYTDYGMTFHPYGNALKAKLSQLVPEITTSVDIEGRSGDCALSSLGGNARERLIKACGTASRENPKYDVVIFLSGTNDLAYKLGAGLSGAEEVFTHGVKPLYEYILGTGTSLIAMTVPERSIDTKNSDLAVKARANREHLNRLIMNWVSEEQSSSSKVWLFDLAKQAPFPRDKSEDDKPRFRDAIWSPDGLHMSASGYDFVGNELAAFIQDVL